VLGFLVHWHHHERWVLPMAGTKLSGVQRVNKVFSCKKADRPHRRCTLRGYWRRSVP